MKKVSIITINLNNFSGLKKTLLSIINQTFIDFELIIIDGGSNDESLELIKAHEQNITFWVSEPDKGIYDAQNKGIGKATGDYCIFMNSGDAFYDKDVLEKVFSVERTSDVIFGNLLRVEKGIKELIIFPKVMTYMFFHKVGLCPQATFVKTSLHKANPFNCNFKIFADRDFYMKLLMENKIFEYINYTICIYDADGYSNLPENRSIALVERKEIVNKYVPQVIQKDYDLLFMIKDFQFLYEDLLKYPRLRSITNKVLKPLFWLYKLLINKKQ
jgi:glycosyltransferase involved in cell wall biosynthesis